MARCPAAAFIKVGMGAMGANLFDCTCVAYQVTMSDALEAGRRHDREGRTPLHHAVARGDEAATRKYLKTYDPLSSDIFYVNALSYSILSRNITIIFLLWQHLGGDNENWSFVARQHWNGLDSAFTPLGVAAERGFLDIVEYLICTLHLKADARDSNGFTPIMLAAQEGHVEVVQFLLRHCADPIEAISFTFRAVPTARAVAVVMGVFEVLREYKVQWRDTALGHRLAWEAVMSGEVRYVREVLGIWPEMLHLRLVHVKDSLNGYEYDADNPDAPDRPNIWPRAGYGFKVLEPPNLDGPTMLQCAVVYGKVEIARFLLESGASVEQRDPRNMCPMDIAARRNGSDMIRLLAAYLHVAVHGGSNVPPTPPPPTPPRGVYPPPIRHSLWHAADAGCVGAFDTILELTLVTPGMEISDADRAEARNLLHFRTAEFKYPPLLPQLHPRNESAARNVRKGFLAVLDDGGDDVANDLRVMSL